MPVKKILFVENSYTAQNDMIFMVQKILNSDPGRRTGYVTGQIILPGKILSDHVESGELAEALQHDKYDAVLLQELSTAPFDEDKRLRSIVAFKTLVEDIRRNGAEPFIWSPWALQAGHAFYVQPKQKNSPMPGNPSAMASGGDIFYRSVATDTKTRYIPVGQYWLNAAEKYPDLNLYEADGNHPNVNGSYLVALLIARQLSGHELRENIWAPPDINESDKALILKKDYPSLRD